MILTGLFVYAGVIKFIHPDAFLADVESYRMLPYSLAWMVSLYLPPVEIICGLGLWIPKLSRDSASILLFLMLVFIAAISGAWVRGLNINCGCFGSSVNEANYLWLIFRDLLISAALLFLHNKQGRLRDPITQKTLTV
jgi:uncharacterized membrane protein